jgi:Serine dehydrogenase proteinase
MSRRERLRIIEKIQRTRKSKVICYLTSDRPNASAQIQKDVMPVFYEHLCHLDEAEHIDVFIVTSGGDTLAAFGLGRLLREFVKWVGVLVPEKCHSAGTLFALSADEIVMSRLATLSPIDPSLHSPLFPAVEIGPGQRQLVPVSVESIAGFHSMVTDGWGIKDEGCLTEIFKILVERVHPIVLGDVTRARDQIERLARKLLELHRKGDKAIDRIVATLTKELGSHDYLIGRTEACELLGKQVAPENATLEGLLHDLYRDFADEMVMGQAFDAGMEIHAAMNSNRSLPVKITQQLALIESASLAHVCDREMLLSAVAIPMGQMPGSPTQHAAHQEILRAGWRQCAPSI